MLQTWKHQKCCTQNYQVFERSPLHLVYWYVQAEVYDSVLVMQNENTLIYCKNLLMMVCGSSLWCAFFHSVAYPTVDWSCLFLSVKKLVGQLCCWLSQCASIMQLVVIINAISFFSRTMTNKNQSTSII